MYMAYVASVLHENVATILSVLSNVTMPNRGIKKFPPFELLLVSPPSPLGALIGKPITEVTTPAVACFRSTVSPP